jgi:hypothetical protein
MATVDEDDEIDIIDDEDDDFGDQDGVGRDGDDIDERPDEIDRMLRQERDLGVEMDSDDLIVFRNDEADSYRWIRDDKLCYFSGFDDNMYQNRKKRI